MTWTQHQGPTHPAPVVMPWTKATKEGRGRRVTIENANGYLVTVSASCPLIAWTVAWAAYDRAMSGGARMVTG